MKKLLVVLAGVVLAIVGCAGVESGAPMSVVAVETEVPLAGLEPGEAPVVTVVELYVYFDVASEAQAIMYFRFGSVGPYIGELGEGFYRETVVPDYSAVTDSSYGLVVCSPEECPSMNSGDWSEQGGFYEGVEREWWEQTKALNPGATRLTIERKQFYAVASPGGAAQLPIELVDGVVSEQMVNFADDTSVTLGEILESLGLSAADVKLGNK